MGSHSMYTLPNIVPTTPRCCGCCGCRGCRGCTCRVMLLLLFVLMFQFHFHHSIQQYIITNGTQCVQARRPVVLHHLIHMDHSQRTTLLNGCIGGHCDGCVETFLKMSTLNDLHQCHDSMTSRDGAGVAMHVFGLGDDHFCIAGIFQWQRF